MQPVPWTLAHAAVCVLAQLLWLRCGLCIVAMVFLKRKNTATSSIPRRPQVSAGAGRPQARPSGAGRPQTVQPTGTSRPQTQSVSAGRLVGMGRPQVLPLPMSVPASFSLVSRSHRRRIVPPL